MEQTPRAFFQTTFEPVGRVCAARHARGGVELQGKWRTRACVPHTPYMRATACRTTCFPCRTLNSSRYPVLSPRGRELERGQQAARLVFGQLGYCERLPQFGECPLPSPPPQGRGRIAAGFAVAGSLRSSLGLQPLISGRLKNKKQPAQPVFLAEPLTPTATPSSLPWERVRERATSRKACIGAVRVLRKVAAIRGIPSPQPSPTGEGAGCSGFKRYRPSEKECPKYQRQEFFR